MTQLNAAGRDAALAAGARAATDITRFGLAVHAIEMAQASDVTCVLQVDDVPYLSGVLDLVGQRFRTRASESNRSLATSSLSIVDEPDSLRLELLFDPQTSGGLLISVAADRAENVAQCARDAGAQAATIVGWVEEKQDHWLVARG